MGGRDHPFDRHPFSLLRLCIYIADDPDAIHEHARLAGLPVDAVHRIGSVIDPSTGDE